MCLQPSPPAIFPFPPDSYMAGREIDRHRSMLKNPFETDKAIREISKTLYDHFPAIDQKGESKLDALRCYNGGRIRPKILACKSRCVSKATSHFVRESLPSTIYVSESQTDHRPETHLRIDPIRTGISNPKTDSKLGKGPTHCGAYWQRYGTINHAQLYMDTKESYRCNGDFPTCRSLCQPHRTIR